MTDDHGMPRTREELEELIDGRMKELLARTARQMWHLGPYLDDTTHQALSHAGNALDDVVQDKDR